MTDYAALAKQFGGTSTPTATATPSPSGAPPGGVDYAALAKKFGGTSAPASPNGAAPLTPAPAPAPTPASSPQPNILEKATSPGAFPSSPTDSPIAAAAKTFGNVIPSAINFGKNVLDFLNPFNTVKKAQDLGTSIAGAEQEGVKPMDVVKGLPAAAYHVLVPKFFQQLFSGDIEGAQKTITDDPSGQLLPVILGGKALADQAGFGPQFDQVVSKVASPVTTPAAAVASKAGDLIGQGGSQVLGTATGAGASSVKEAWNGSQAFTDAMRGKIDPETVVQTAQNVVGTIADNRRSAYLDSLNNLGQQTGSLDISPVTSALQTQLDNFNIKVAPDGTLDFSRSSIANNGTARADVQGVYDTLKDWGSQKGDRTPVGLDTLKKQLADFYSPSSSARALVQAVKSKVTGILNDQVPGYQDMTSDYGKASDLLDQIKSATGVGGKAGVDAMFTKMTSALRGDKALRLEVLKEMQSQPGSPDLMGQLAGMNMQSLMPTGLVGKFGDIGAALSVLSHTFKPEFIPMLLSTSPRLVGEFVHGLGFTAAKVSSVMDAINKLPKTMNTEDNTATAFGGTAESNTQPGQPAGLPTNK